MTVNILNEIHEKLEHERAQCSTKADELRAQLLSVESELSKIDAVMFALSSDIRKPSLKRTKSLSRKPLNGTAPKKLDVINAMIEALGEDVVIQADVLKERVEKRLVKQGFNRAGLAMRFAEACKDPRFVLTRAGLRLSAALRRTGDSICTNQSVGSSRGSRLTTTDHQSDESCTITTVASAHLPVDTANSSSDQVPADSGTIEDLQSLKSDRST